VKKSLLVGLLVVLSVFVFSLPQISVSKNSTDNSFSLEMKLFKVSIDSNGHFQDFRIINARTNTFTPIYGYGFDSFDIVNENTGTEYLPSYSEYYVEDSGEYADITFYFNDAKTAYKKYRFYNSAEFKIDVEINGLNGIVRIPNISNPTYPQNIKTNGNQMISYLPKPLKSVLAISSDSEIDNLKYRTSGKTNTTLYMGPFKLTYINNAFAEREGAYASIKEMLKDVGAIGWTTNIFYWFVDFLWWLYKITGNFGWAIIIFTVIIRVVLYPLYHKQTKSMVAMRQMQPEIDKIKKKYTNPQKQQEELMKMYKEKNFNSAGGCLTALVQLPVFIILWQVIQYFGESFAYNPRFLFWSDLSAGGFSKNILLVTISLIAYIANALLSSQESKMAWQNILMSVIFPFFLINLPTGVFIYYATNAVIQTGITFYANKKNNIKGITIRQLLGLGPKKIRR